MLLDKLLRLADGLVLHGFFLVRAAEQHVPAGVDVIGLQIAEGIDEVKGGLERGGGCGELRWQILKDAQPEEKELAELLVRVPQPARFFQVLLKEGKVLFGKRCVPVRIHELDSGKKRLAGVRREQVFGRVLRAEIIFAQEDEAVLIKEASGKGLLRVQIRGGNLPDGRDRLAYADRDPEIGTYAPVIQDADLQLVQRLEDVSLVRILVIDERNNLIVADRGDDFLAEGLEARLLELLHLRKDEAEVVGNGAAPVHRAREEVRDDTLRIGVRKMEPVPLIKILLREVKDGQVLIDENIGEELALRLLRRLCERAERFARLRLDASFFQNFEENGLQVLFPQRL